MPLRPVSVNVRSAAVGGWFRVETSDDANGHHWRSEGWRPTMTWTRAAAARRWRAANRRWDRATSWRNLA